MNTQNEICEKVYAYLEQQKMIGADDIVLAGVSGGSDSVCMLFMLDEYRKRVLFDLNVIHVHHGIRGEEADRDCLFVEEICREMGLPLTIVRKPVPLLAREWKVSEEEAGRLVRQTAFKEESERLSSLEGKTVKTALAHNRNDLAETVLHHLARGTGLAGLSSMRPVSGSIIRPLLLLDKKEILSYLEKNDIPYKEDSTNFEDDYTRNRIRHHLLPLLTEINEKAIPHIASASQMAGEACDYLLEKGRNIVRFAPEKGTCLFDEHFFGSHPLEQKYGILWALSALSGSRKDLGAVHVEQILGLYGRQTGRRIDLPGNLKAFRVYEGVLLKTSSSEKGTIQEETIQEGTIQEGTIQEGTIQEGTTAEETAPEEKIPLKKTTEEKIPQERMSEEKACGIEILSPGENVHSGWEKTVKVSGGWIKARIFSYSGEGIEEKKYTKWMDYDKIKNSLFIRPRKTGDHMQITRDGRQKKLSRIFMDDRIPREDRDGCLLIAEGPEILWIVGGRMSEKVKIMPDTIQVLEIQYQEE